MEQQTEHFVLPEPTPSGVCGWCHIAISDEYWYYQVHGNMCDKCSARVARSLGGAPREEIDKDLTREFKNIHLLDACAKINCDKNI
jgi:hypothetical protein